MADNTIDYAADADASMANHSVPQRGRSKVVRASIDALNAVEYAKMNRILEKDYNQTQLSILDKPLGDILNETVNFFGNSFDRYSDKYREATFSRPLYETDNTHLHKFQLHLIATSLYMRDDDTVVYLGIILIILSFLICFINITRGNEPRLLEASTKP
jgi:hypothetical protein